MQQRSSNRGEGDTSDAGIESPRSKLRRLHSEAAHAAAAAADAAAAATEATRSSQEAAAEATAAISRAETAATAAHDAATAASAAAAASLAAAAAVATAATEIGLADPSITSDIIRTPRLPMPTVSAASRIREVIDTDDDLNSDNGDGNAHRND